MDSVAALLFDGFELLDVFGPLEAFGHLAESGKCRLITVAERAGAIASRQGPPSGRRLRPRAQSAISDAAGTWRNRNPTRG